MHKSLVGAALVLAVGSAQYAAEAATVINIYNGPATPYRPGARPATPRVAAPSFPSPIATPAPVTLPPVAAPAVAAPAPVSAPAALDGAALYSQNCAGCHGQSMKGKSASSIQSAINENEGGMGSLRGLSPAQIQAISGSSGSSSSTKKSKKD